MFGLGSGRTAQHQGIDHGLDAWIVRAPRRVQHHALACPQAADGLINKRVQADLPIAAGDQRGGIHRQIDETCGDGGVDLQRA